jgi:hypothetical protein
MTAEKFERCARLVVELARDDPTGDDLVTLVLAAVYMLPENVRLRERILARHKTVY